MMISDAGKTFGRANALNNDDVAAVNFTEWSRQPIWNGATGCVGDRPRSWSGTLRDPRVGEAGRKFPADLLVQLSDTQLRDLFEVSRSIEPDPTATIDDWSMPSNGSEPRSRVATSTHRCVRPSHSEFLRFVAGLDGDLFPWG